MNCSLCGHAVSREVFHGTVRAGAPGVVSTEAFTIEECMKCRVRRLVPFPESLDTFYESPDYRDAYNLTHDCERIAALHLELRQRIVDRVDCSSLLGKTVVDFGCADGGLLNLVADVARTTIGIEPAAYFHPYLRSKGHEVFSYGRDLVKTGRTADVALSFSVIEHVPSPLDFVRDMYAILADGGRLVLSTPNIDDILEHLVPESFRPFNYRTAHLYYFGGESLRILLESVGFRQITIGYLHLYDLSNLLAWYKHEKPTGLGSIPLFDERINAPLRAYLEETGRASDIWAEAIK
jgi:2-polyprenyl-3-methyl-5-hydroxy-6-metoxy-1,4-benzoquinol methylase